MDIQEILGMVFTSPTSGHEYGVVRDLKAETTPDFFASSSWAPFAEDDCGNFFAMSPEGRIAFWDHETDQVEVLAESFQNFCAHCSEQKEVELRDDQVKSAWIDPEFAKQLGLDAPDDGNIEGES